MNIYHYVSVSIPHPTASHFTSHNVSHKVQYICFTELGPKEESEDLGEKEEEKEHFVAFCRIYSGRIEPGKQVSNTRN